MRSVYIYWKVLANVVWCCSCRLAEHLQVMVEEAHPYIWYTGSKNLSFFEKRKICTPVLGWIYFPRNNIPSGRSLVDLCSIEFAGI